MADSVKLDALIREVSPTHGIVRMISQGQDLDFITRFLRAEDRGDGDVALLFAPDSERDFGIELTSTAPKKDDDGLIVFGTSDKWRIREASAEEAAAFEEAWVL